MAKFDYVINSFTVVLCYGIGQQAMTRLDKSDPWR
jgi:hypothetical protein